MVYAPIAANILNRFVTGRSRDYGSLMPSGFVILPSGPGLSGSGLVNDVGSRGCVVTIAYQMLVGPTHEVIPTPGTVSNLCSFINSTIDIIKEAMMC